MTILACQQSLECGHRVKLDIADTQALFGDMPVDQCRRRLRCSKCGGRARMITSFE